MTTRAVLSAAALLSLASASARAQYVAPHKRPATGAEVLGVNVLLGGATAMVRAFFTGADPLRAFAIGSLGGAVHLAGKYVAVQAGPGLGWAGLAIAGTGTSVVSNAGRGVSPLAEVTVPLPGLRFRVTPGAERRVRVVLNAYEAISVAQYALHDDVRVDWAQTTASGTMVFVTDEKHIMFDDSRVHGVAVGPVAIISEFALDAPATARHEIVHVHQSWFAQEVWGRPIEDAVRSRLPFGDRIPAWLELGIGAPGLFILEHELVGRRGTRLLKEAEASLLERR
ncbi:MAG: hypothetical protein WD801_08175 [Gemmatimonadaceae bacterium]